MPHFSLQQTYRGKLQLLFEVYFFMLFFSVRIRSVFNVKNVPDKCYKYVRFCL